MIQLKHRRKFLLMAVVWSLILAALVTWIVVKRPGTSVKHRQVNQTTIDSLLTIKVPEGYQRVDYKGFTVYFDSVRHLPACVEFVLTPDRLDGTIERSEHFMADDSVKGCPAPDAYAGSGFHRGHMAPAADMKWDQQAMDQSFLMTNVCPQDPALNEGGWSLLEEKCREWARRDSVVLVFTGPVPDDNLQVLPESRVCVPRRFFKVVVSPSMNPMQALAFVYPNGTSRRTLSHYVTTVGEVEHLTGIDFFAEYPQDVQQRVQSRSLLDLWLH